MTAAGRGDEAGPAIRRLAVRPFSKAAERRSAGGRETRPRPLPGGPAGAAAKTPGHSVTEGRSVRGRLGPSSTGGTPAGSEPDHSDGAPVRELRPRRTNAPAATPAAVPIPSPP
jgi:hypothetical protein